MSVLLKWKLVVTKEQVEGNFDPKEDVRMAYVPPEGDEEFKEFLEDVKKRHAALGPEWVKFRRLLDTFHLTPSLMLGLNHLDLAIG